MTNLSASQIAAQAAMHVTQHNRQRSQTTPDPTPSPPSTFSGKKKPPPIQTAASETARLPSGPKTPGRQYYNGAVGGHSMAAATAANAAMPRSPQISPSLTSFQLPEKEHKLKSERSKMKLFSKPKDKKDSEKDRPLPSPNKVEASRPSTLSKMVNPSVTSLADSLASGASSIYSAQMNTSTSTLVPSTRDTSHGGEKEKGHKHHFLSRQKHRLKDKIDGDHPPLPSSSAGDISKTHDSTAPPSLYSFAPQPASPATSSFSGLDLRHGGRALREKKKEGAVALPFAPKKSDMDKAEWALLQSGITTPGGHPPSLFGGPASSYGAESGAGLQSFGLNNMRPEDAWDFLRAKLLAVFEFEEIRIPVEDLNRLVAVHVKRSIVKRVPSTLLEDLRSLLATGFVSLDHTLRGIPDHRLVPHLVEMWLFVFGTILPYMQAVFLPLDLEFKGHGSLLSESEAAEFWGADPDGQDLDQAFGNEFDVRRIVLLSYRDNVILPHFEALKATFSRLSLDSINVNPATPLAGAFGEDSGRPSTAASLDPGTSSFNSQSSTLLNDSNSSGRSRAASNLSAPEIPSFGSPSGRRPNTTQPDSAMVTETIGRMLQCISVLASVQSGDGSQRKMEDLAKALKLNWLGRGRTGRNRKGFVGARVGVVRAPSAREGASMLSW